MSSNFSFVKDDMLRENLDIAFNHLLDLIPLSESTTYGPLAKSSFRKTVIIYTASIIEGLLLYLLRQKCTEDDLTIYKWELAKHHELYKVSETHYIIAGDYEKRPEKFKFEKLNLGNISKFLSDRRFISTVLYNNVDKVRLLRNEQHLGMHKEIKDYTKTDLEFVFSVAKDVKQLFS
jgi:hypothetical protein